jgi:hypothetical protein
MLPFFIVHVRAQHSVLRKKRPTCASSSCGEDNRGSSSLRYGGASLSGCGADIRGGSSLGSGSSSLSDCCADIRSSKLLLQFANPGLKLLLQFANPGLRSSKLLLQYGSPALGSGGADLRLEGGSSCGSNRIPKETCNGGCN